MEKKREEMSRPNFYNKNVWCSFWLKLNVMLNIIIIGCWIKSVLLISMEKWDLFRGKYQAFVTHIMKRVSVYWKKLVFGLEFLVFCAFTVWSLKHQCFFFLFFSCRQQTCFCAALERLYHMVFFTVSLSVLSLWTGVTHHCSFWIVSYSLS